MKMPKYKVSAKFNTIDKDRFTKDFYHIAERIMKVAASEFLLAVYPRIPIYTGFARGALARLEALVGRVVQGSEGGFTLNKRLKAVPTYPGYTTGIRPGYTYFDPRSGTNIKRTPQNGLFYGTPTDEIITPGRITKATVAGRIVFYYEIDITYVETLDARKWGAFEAGQAAFDTAMRDGFASSSLKVHKYIVERR